LSIVYTSSEKYLRPNGILVIFLALNNFWMQTVNI
jgi:hypothetical protein